MTQLSGFMMVNVIAKQRHVTFPQQYRTTYFTFEAGKTTTTNRPLTWLTLLFVYASMCNMTRSRLLNTALNKLFTKLVTANANNWIVQPTDHQGVNLPLKTAKTILLNTGQFQLYTYEPPCDEFSHRTTVVKVVLKRRSKRVGMRSVPKMSAGVHIFCCTKTTTNTASPPVTSVTNQKQVQRQTVNSIQLVRS